MPLTATQVKNAKPGRRPPQRLKGVRGSRPADAERKLDSKSHTDRKPEGRSYKLYDGQGLYIDVFANGAKIWRFRYKFPLAKTISLGKYPKVSLVEARKERDKCLEQLARGIDPSLYRKLKRRVKSGQTEDSFEAIAREWLEKFIKPMSESHSKRVYARFENDIFPWLGKRPIREISPPEMLAVILKIEDQGAGDTAHRTLGSCSQVYRYAISKGVCDSDTCRDLRGALKPVEEGHFAAVTKPQDLTGVLRAIDGYKGTFPVQCALRIAPLLFVRPVELRTAKWADIDLDNAVWYMELSKQDKRRQERLDIDDHLNIPLSTQVVEILRAVHKFSGSGTYVFPGLRTKERPMSENAVLAALRRLGIPKEEMCGHGFRATARTILREQLKIEQEYIEHELGHQVIDPNGRAYNRASFFSERRLLMQEWANYLDKLKSGGEIDLPNPVPLTDIRMIQVSGYRN